VIFVIVLPYLGVFIYLIARGHKMTEHAVQAAEAQDVAQRAYIQSAVGALIQHRRRACRLADAQASGRHLRRRVRTAQGKALS